MKKIHIVGGGISGCFLSYFLKKDFEVILYEKNPYLGGLCHTSKTIEGIPFQNSLHSLKNPDNWILNIIREFIPINEVDIKIGINPFTDFNTFDYPLHIDNVQKLSWHWIEKIKIEIEQVKEDYSEEFLFNFLLKNYGETISEIFYRNYYKKLYDKNLEEILFNSYRTDFVSLMQKRNDKYYFPLDIGWNDLFNKLTTNIKINLNSNVNIIDINKEDIIICTTRPDLFLNEDRIKLRNSIFDIDSSIYKKDYYDTVLYPNYLPFVSITQMGKLYPKFQKNIIVKEYVSDTNEGETTYIPLTRENEFRYNKIYDDHKNIIFSGRLASFGNISMVDAIKKASAISAKLKMENKNG